MRERERERVVGGWCGEQTTHLLQLQQIKMEMTNRDDEELSLAWELTLILLWAM